MIRSRSCNRIVAVTSAGILFFGGIPTYADYADLRDAVADITNPRSYTLTADENVSVNLGNMGGSSSQLTIDGSSNKYGINALSPLQSIIVPQNKNQTLIVKNIGSYLRTEEAGNVVYTALKSWNGFEETSGNQRFGAIYNYGTLNVSDSVFYNNTGRWGGAINNNSSGSSGTVGEAHISNTVFIENSTPTPATDNVDHGGGAIYNQSVNGMYISDSVFYNNIAKNGGAIYNKSGFTIDSISGSLFLENKLYDPISNPQKYLGGAIYNDGTITEIVDSNFIKNTNTYRGGAIYNFEHGIINDIVNSHFDNNSGTYQGGAIYNIGRIDNIIGSHFENNSITSNTSNHNGAAIYNDSTIDKITGSYFVENTNVFDGGAIYNSGTINEISNSYFGNNEASNQGSAIANYGDIGIISNSVFENNTTGTHYGAIYNKEKHLSSSAPATIGTISNVTFQNNNGDGVNSNGYIGLITGSNFLNNTYNGIKIDKSSVIDAIENTTFSENSYSGINIAGNASITNYIKNSTFLDNGATSTGAKDHRGAGIFSENNVTVQSDNGDTIFQGNVNNSIATGIYMYFTSGSKTLTLDQINEGNMYMYDPVRGSNGYRVDITGDGTGTLYLYNDIVGAYTTVTNTNVSLVDNNLFDYSFKTLSSDDNSNWKIDVDLINGDSDTISTTSLEQAVVNHIKLNEINVIEGDWRSFDEDTVDVQILNTQTNLQLALADNLQVENLIYSDIENPGYDYADVMNANTSWDHVYHKYHKDDDLYNVYGTWSTKTTTTANDTLGVAIRKAIEIGETHDLGSNGDTLKLVNKDTTNPTKNFTAASDGDNYTVTEALGGTKGTVNVNGVHGGATETVTLGTHTGFELGDGATALNFTDVTVTGTNGIATVTNGDATIGVTDSIINGTITGTAPFAMTTSGTSELNGAVTNATITNSGTLTTTAENISASTLTNNSTLNLSGALSDTILGTGTTKINTALTLNSGATINGALNMNNGTLTVSSGSTTTHNIGSMSGNGNLNIDLNLEGASVDKFNLANVSSGTVTLNSVNILDLSTPLVKDFSVNVLNAAAGSSIQLALSEAVQTLFNSKEDVIDSSGETITYDPVLLNTPWTVDYYNKYTTTGETVYGKLGLSDDKLSIRVAESRREGGNTLTSSAGDTLMFINKDTTNSVKNFNAISDGDSYNVTEALGATKGTVNVNGIHGGDAETVNLGSHTGFELGTGANALNFNDVTVNAANTIANVSNGDAAIGINDSIINGTLTGTVPFNISTTGNSALNGAVSNAIITNSGNLTTTAENISNSTITNNSNLYLSGALANTILGSGNTFINTALTLNSGATINGALNMNNGTLTVSTDSITSHTMGSMSGNGNLNIDLNLTNGTVDNFTLSNVSSGTLTLTDVNILDPATTNLADDFSVNVLNAAAGSTIQLALSAAVSTAFNAKEYVIGSTGEIVIDDVVSATSSWTPDLYERHTTTAETVYGKLGLSDDKQSIEVSESRREGGVTTDTSLGDTLKLVNQDTTNPTKSFTTTVSGDSYTVTEALGGTKGTVNVNGVHGGATETVTLGTHTGFELGDGATALNFTDVTVTGTNGIATVTNGDATIGVTDSIINGTITGTAPFTMTTSGTSELNGAVTNATITNSGTLTTTAENISDSILTNNSTLNLSGALSDTILGTGTTKINTALTLNSGATINGALNMNNGTLTVSPDAITTHNIGSMSGNGNLNIDLNLAGASVDKFNLANVSSGTLTLTDVNILDPATIHLANDFSVNVLNAAAGSTIQLALSAAVSTAFDATQYIIGSSGEVVTEDAVLSTSSWTPDLYERHTTTAETIYGKLRLSSNKNSIEVYESGRDGGATINTTLGDTLKLVNQDTTNPTKSFTTTVSGDSYTVTEALGGTKGTVNVNGVHGGATETVTLGTHTGFELGDGATALNFTDVTVTGTNGIATVTNGDATIGVTDSIINGTITGTAPFAMTTSGTSELNGAVSNAIITNSGNLTTTAENISNSTITNNNMLNLSGALSETILGTGTTKINTALTLNSGATINGALNMNNGNLTVSTDSITSHTIGSMSGNGYLNIDLDLANASVDNFTLSNVSSGTLTLTDVNILDPATINLADDFSVNVLNAAAGSTIQLALSAAVSTAFNAKEYVIGSTGEIVIDDVVSATSSWTPDLYERHTTTAETVYGKLGLSDDKQSIEVSESRREGGVTTDTSLGDTLKLVNQDTTNPTKSFTTTVSGDSYTVTEALGGTKGTVNVNGVHGGATETVTLGTHTGFELGDGATALNFTDVTVTGTNGIATVTNGDATIGVTDSVINGTITGTTPFAMTTSGTSELNGAVSNAIITNSGTLTTTAENISDSTLTNNSTIFIIPIDSRNS